MLRCYWDWSCLLAFPITQFTFFFFPLHAENIDSKHAYIYDERKAVSLDIRGTNSNFWLKIFSSNHTNKMLKETIEFQWSKFVCIPSLIPFFLFYCFSNAFDFSQSRSLGLSHLSFDLSSIFSVCAFNIIIILYSFWWHSVWMKNIGALHSHKLRIPIETATNIIHIILLYKSIMLLFWVHGGKLSCEFCVCVLCIIPDFV